MGCTWGNKKEWPNTKFDNTVTRTIGEQESFSNIYRGVPAHFLHIEVTDVENDDGRINSIFSFFQGVSPLVRTIDLLDTPGQEKSIAEGEKKQAEGNGDTGRDNKAKSEEDKALAKADAEVEADEGAVRFQWDGVLKMVVKIPDKHGEDLLECDTYDDGYPQPGTPGKSFHVMEYMQLFDVSVKLHYELAPGIFCDIVDADELKVCLCLVYGGGAMSAISLDEHDLTVLFFNYTDPD